MLIPRGDGYLPVTRVAVQRREKLGVSQGIQTVIHSWERIRVTHRSIVELTIVDAKACGPIRLRWILRRTAVRRQYCSCSTVFTDPPGSHTYYF